MRQDDKYVTGLVDLITQILNDTKGINQPIWYRGQEDMDWKLSPTIFRSGQENPREIQLLRKFKQDATLFMNPRPVHQYEWLFIMRHYRVPTRLIDWTESPLVGAYFSSEGSEKELSEKDGALWVLLPLELNKHGSRRFDVTGANELPSFQEDEIMNSYEPENYYRETSSELPPIAFIAPRNSARMQSQLSTFTISHRVNQPIEEVGDGKHVWRYIIPKDVKEQLKQELAAIGIGRFQLFPELESIGIKLRGKE